MRDRRLYVVSSLCVVAAAMLAGCSNGPGGVDKADQGLVLGGVAGGLIGNSLGKGTGGKIGATAAGALIGGLLGNQIGRNLDERDRQLAQEAEYDALERGTSGTARKWNNPDNGRYGEIVPSKPYKRGGNDCRDYTHTIYIDSRPQQLRGTACRNPDGTWNNVG